MTEYRMHTVDYHDFHRTVSIERQNQAIQEVKSVFMKQPWIIGIKPLEDRDGFSYLVPKNESSDDYNQILEHIIAETALKYYHAA